MPQPNAKRPNARRDPKPRPVSATPAGFQLRNADPDRDYVLVDKATPGFDVAAYEELGYEVEHFHEDRVQLIGVKKPTKDGAWETRGNVLMSRPKAISQQLFEQGQAEADFVEGQIVDKRIGQHDPFRGLTAMRGGLYFGLQNETSPLG